MRKMGVINVKISDDTEKSFRMELLERMGYRKGIMGKAVDEALRNWIFRPYFQVRKEDPNLPLYARTIWVQDIPKEKAAEFKRNSDMIYPKLEYFVGPPMKKEEEGYVGMYYRLRKGAEP